MTTNKSVLRLMDNGNVREVILRPIECKDPKKKKKKKTKEDI